MDVLVGREPLSRATGVPKFKTASAMFYKKKNIIRNIIHFLTPTPYFFGGGDPRQKENKFIKIFLVTINFQVIL
jgi:hypothetical protein